MFSTMDQLQQLTNSQLCILCYKFSISPQHAANLNRRQLERRLHVAIIGERAKWRARQLLQPGQQRNVSGWPRYERSLFDEYHHLTLSEWRLMAAREQSIWMGTGRQASGKEQLKLLDDDEEQQAADDDEEQLMHEEKDMYNKVALPEHNEPKIESKHALQQQQQQQQQQQVVDRDRESIEYYGQDQATDYLSFSSSVNSRSCLSLDKALELPQRCAENQLQKSERFTCLDSISLTCSDSEPELSTERILCTINYLTEEQLLADDIGQLVRWRKPNENTGDTLLLERISTRRRPALWRYLLDLLFSSSPKDKMASHKLHYTILCCAVVICTLVGVKMLQ